ncbi:uncharacterized protein LOC113213192 isoform X2 [Frankliniella occidentalis]|uniref:Uncharacterized protein LOC113213192 isoform X2 n=1 Tax=Frankliniella occidentalis TaxID=133901 RepID=A0A9C6WRJ4_FRAOC|nr:uncharacterized protein LOC113213192 isoform X2 [Frankliniella occidentalis]
MPPSRPPKTPSSSDTARSEHLAVVPADGGACAHGGLPDRRDEDNDSADTWSTSAGSVASDLDDDAVVATTAGALRGVAVEGSSDVHIGGTHTHVHAAPGSQVTLALTASNPPALTATGRQGRQPPAAAGQDGVIANPPLPATVQDLRPPTAALQETTAQDQCPPVELEGIVVQGQQPPAVPQATVQHQYQHEGGLVARAMWRALTWREAYWKLHFGFFLCKKLGGALVATGIVGVILWILPYQTSS